MNKKKVFKKLAIVLIAVVMGSSVYAQKVNYKSGLLQVDGVDVAKIVKIKDKENFGITSTYELYNMSDEKLIIATIASNFIPDRNDNTSYYYRLSFLSVSQTGIFSMSKLGPEKSFAKLIGESGIMVNGQIDVKLLNELIATKSKDPRIAIEYNLVKRVAGFPVTVDDNKVFQGQVQIGQFKDITSSKDYDTYEFKLPEGLVVATVSFSGGNGAQNCTVSTNKDRRTQNGAIPSKGKFGELSVRSEGMDRNAIALAAISRWLVTNGYL